MELWVYFGRTVPKETIIPGETNIDNTVLCIPCVVIIKKNSLFFNKKATNINKTLRALHLYSIYNQDFDIKKIEFKKIFILYNITQRQTSFNVYKKYSIKNDC